MPRSAPPLLAACLAAAVWRPVAGLVLSRGAPEGSVCGPPLGTTLPGPRGNASGAAVCEELERFPFYLTRPDPPATPCNIKTGEHCRAVLRLGGAIGDPFAGFSATFGTYTINQLLLAETLGMIPYAAYDEERAGSYWEKEKGKRSNAWEYYFKPVSGYSPGDERFSGLPVCTVGGHLNLQLHYRQGWTVRTWPYGCEKRRRYEEIVKRSRPVGAKVVARYYMVNPEVKAAVEGALGEGRKWGKQKVLGMHIRGTDKGNGRHVVGPDAYFVPARDFVRKYPDALIYLATDDSGFRDKVLAWPSEVSGRVVAPPVFALASTSDHPFGGKQFRREEGFHALVDVLALSKCDWLLHSVSGLAELAVYFRPRLQARSTNLERNETPSYNLP